MIHLNSTSPFSAASSASGPMANLGNQINSESFQSALSAALTETLQKFGIDPKQVTLSIAPSANLPAPPASSPSVASTPASHAIAASVVPAATTPVMPSTDDPSFDDAYWAKQPAAVQALRGMEDFDQRREIATQLASQGLSIDVPIMVWGWDPAKVTSLRHDFGYTWVPSAMQNPIKMAPGLTAPTDSYDPNNPPAGSIMA